MLSVFTLPSLLFMGALAANALNIMDTPPVETSPNAATGLISLGKTGKKWLFNRNNRFFTICHKIKERRIKKNVHLEPDDTQVEIIPEIFEQQIIFIDDIATILFEPKT